jgi:hypothetical protein
MMIAFAVTYGAAQLGSVAASAIRVKEPGFEPERDKAPYCNRFRAKLQLRGAVRGGVML